jgi:hypothetical protein
MNSSRAGRAVDLEGPRIANPLAALPPHRDIEDAHFHRLAAPSARARHQVIAPRFRGRIATITLMDAEGAVGTRDPDANSP